MLKVISAIQLSVSGYGIAICIVVHSCFNWKKINPTTIGTRKMKIHLIVELQINMTYIRQPKYDAYFWATSNEC